MKFIRVVHHGLIEAIHNVCFFCGWQHELSEFYSWRSCVLCYAVVHFIVWEMLNIFMGFFAGNESNGF
jgi:hypothetical protein